MKYKKIHATYIQAWLNHQMNFFFLQIIPCHILSMCYSPAGVLSREMRYIKISVYGSHFEFNKDRKNCDSNNSISFVKSSGENEIK